MHKSWIRCEVCDIHHNFANKAYDMTAKRVVSTLASFASGPISLVSSEGEAPYHRGSGSGDTFSGAGRGAMKSDAVIGFPLVVQSILEESRGHSDDHVYAHHRTIA